MKPSRLFLSLLCLTAALKAQAQFVETVQFTGLSLSVPDGDSSGVSNTQTITSSVTSIGDLNVSLSIEGRGSGAFNGDLYVTLTHETGFSVLLNRTGRRSGSVLGYSDNGFNVTLDDEAANGDIHNYRLILNGNHTTPLSSSPLTGIWAPDGRYVDPDSVLSSTPRNNLLDEFNGMDANGAWTLFIADLETGGTARLVSWSLEFTSVPEPHEYAMLTAAGLLGFALVRRRLIRVEASQS